jgi:methylmalonyl-CoA/ethylmalonyl-CoA epimerase
MDGAGPIANALEKRGPGIHHICFRSDNLQEDIERLKSKGYRFIDETPRDGAHGSRVVFIHPKSTGGVLIELAEMEVHP